MPKSPESEKSMKKCYFKYTKGQSLLSGQASGTEDLKAAISLLSQERTALLVCNSYPEDIWSFPTPAPCVRIRVMQEIKKCICFKKAEIELLYTQSNLKEILKKENFEHFSFDYYSDTMRNEATGLTERETAKKAFDTARNFVRTFDSCFENLFSLRRYRRRQNLSLPLTSHRNYWIQPLCHVLLCL